jgi:hypothetical protein
LTVKVLTDKVVRQKTQTAGIGLATSGAKVLFCSEVLFIYFCACVKCSAFKPRLRQAFSVIGHFKKTTQH